jgi:signal transduction histidine kinase
VPPSPSRLLPSDLPSREADLQHTLHLAAVGRLAAGIAHDFNNLLTCILGYGELVRDDLGRDHPCRADLEQVLGAGRKAEALSRQLLAFGRSRPATSGPSDVNHVLTAFVPLLKRLVGDEIQIELSRATAPALVGVGRGPLEFLIMHLAVYARDALDGAGRLGIAVVLEAGTSGSPGVVSLVVGDTTVALRDGGTPRVPHGHPGTRELGAGLGLTFVRDIVADAGGTVDVRQGDGGLRCSVRLPALGAGERGLEPAAAVPAAGADR